MAARAFKYPLTNTASEAEMLKASMGVSHEDLLSPAISVNVRWGWNKTESILAKSNRRAGAEGFNSVIIFIPVKKGMKNSITLSKKGFLDYKRKNGWKSSRPFRSNLLYRGLSPR
jgi:hypothetical protein